MTATLAQDTDLVARLVDIAPHLRERAGETAATRSIPRESLDELISSGMTRVFVPKQYGGLEVSVRTFVDATAAVA